MPGYYSQTHHFEYPYLVGKILVVLLHGVLKMVPKLSLGSVASVGYIHVLLARTDLITFFCEAAAIMKSRSIVMFGYFLKVIGTSKACQ